VLSYVGVGVDPSMNSFGGMINLARNEMSRDPVVWWSFALGLRASWWPWCWRPTCLPTACAMPSTRARAASRPPPPDAPRTKGRPDMLTIDQVAGRAGQRSGLVRAIDGLRLTHRARRDLRAGGRVGCGKSMTALALMRLLPDNGRITGGASTRSGGKTDCWTCPSAPCAACAAAASA
jgi:hypothetical protein